MATSDTPKDQSSGSQDKEAGSSAVNAPSQSPLSAPKPQSVAAANDSAPPLYTIDFGENKWLSHIGGDFRGVESLGDIWWNWVGEGPCWCVLPQLETIKDYYVRLEAIPLAPFNAELRKFTVKLGDDVIILRIVPVFSVRIVEEIALPLSSLASLVSSAPANDLSAKLTLTWEKMPPPAICVKVNSLPLADLVFDPQAEMQRRGFILHREFIAKQTVLYFHPNYACSPKDLGNSEDRTPFSFRFFRLTVHELR
ncbi:MAG: hypothetical protein WCK47_02600 [bacterium]